MYVSNHRSIRGLLTGLGGFVLAAAGLPTLATGSATAHAAPAVNGMPRPDHVVIAVFENTSAGSIYGNPSAPYMNLLAGSGAKFTNSFAIEHPSEPNYLDLFSGSNQGITDDSCPNTFSTDNEASQLIAAGLTFTGYAEDLPSAGATDCTSGSYARKHNPWSNFTNIPVQDNQPFSSFPTDFTQLPTVSWVVPNLCDDMHDCPIATGDTWLQDNLDTYVQWANSHNSVLITTFDEDDSSGDNAIATFINGQPVKNGSYNERINHFSILRTIEDMYDLPHIGDAANATPITDVWNTASLPPGPQPIVKRLAGHDRYATGIAVSQRQWSDFTDTAPGAKKAQAVVLARGDEFADALAGVPLAASVNGPLLLTPTAALDPRADAEIHRVIGPGSPAKTVYILGGTSAVSPAVEHGLRTEGYKVARLAGPDRYATARVIAVQGLGSPANVIVATGQDFPDALAAGPYAAGPFSNNGQPAAIVLSHGRTLDPETASYIASKLVGSTAVNPHVTVVGGQAKAAVTAMAPPSTFSAFAGSDRYATAAQVAGNFPLPVQAGIATGEQFPDALTGGALMASASGPILLTQPAKLSSADSAQLAAYRPALSEVDVFGGPEALVDNVLAEAAAAIGGTVK
ncbi:cell wall-binding repeat-containing protein [Catenulispora rubra]|uniref:cell wall-binding repeat-containing protein n=1 Tax=Catenulispora rubra TaxID=280293 RepID=UPI0018927C9D|nr:cell wall-binding repeat-containing protein [Catenulispora rubra]